ncbi:YciI family protein [Paralysiella testudinis]|uniref:YCII-related domain-containing protein n=1 Tax=Paralysiella testudinis TaxID=2809020 RepID=A0A892ZDJ9_9NEIS|nr:YciI family protein [Paralysiella testudinis]QRQ81415.1 hypothetical protein JQU52_11955 [Paralysiella testudinis]
MYLINIELHPSAAPQAEQDEILNQHRTWFAKHFEQGQFLILGPFLDKARAGVIIAQAESRAELDAILATDVYYPDLAHYEIREFKAAMVANHIQQFQSK